MKVSMLFTGMVITLEKDYYATVETTHENGMVSMYVCIGREVSEKVEDIMQLTSKPEMTYDLWAEIHNKLSDMAYIEQVWNAMK